MCTLTNIVVSEMPNKNNSQLTTLKWLRFYFIYFFFNFYCLQCLRNVFIIKQNSRLSLIVIRKKQSFKLFEAISRLVTWCYVHWFNILVPVKVLFKADFFLYSKTIYVWSMNRHLITFITFILDLKLKLSL